MSVSTQAWPEQLPARQVRIARPTDRLPEVIRFYRDGLGLTELFRFEEHAGYRGIMLGLPGTDYHLEFTSHEAGSPCPAPTLDNLLVLYFDNAADAERTAQRLGELGHAPVAAENPYWTDNGGITIEDPDGWRVVLMPAPVF
ncbi:VOC family protein [Pseudonocardia spinosispora]|uniref:VOC family protein n=1 Tax=Pseudonocardia spinosispora TaxID=103441 RepID=UPI000563ABF2|nr:VOC family protein [Pseudonocardia spinosispora]